MKYLRCVNCDSIELKIAFSRKSKKWFTKCYHCNWVNRYLEELPNGS